MRALAVGLCVCLAVVPAVDAQDFAKARRLIREGMARDSVPAMAMAVVRDGAIIYEEGFGTATAHTPFELASLAKTFEATAALVLQQRGRLDLDRPANDYLAVPLTSPAWDARAATVRNLLTHTSGLSTFNIGCAPPLDLPNVPCRMPSADETIRRWGIVVSQPGRFDYSNLGYFVLGEVLARAASKPLHELLRDEVFRPLGMMQSTYGPGTDYASAHGNASVHDLALFAAFHMKAHRRDQRSPPILSDAAIDTMQYSTVAADRGQLYGLGWSIEENRFGYRSVLAQGGNERAQAWLRLIPSERVAVAVLSNRGFGFPGDVVDAALAELLPRYAERRRELAQAPASQQSPPTPQPVDISIVHTWTGVIRADGGDVPITVQIGPSGEVHANIAARADTGRARLSNGRLIIRLAGDLEAPNPPGQSRRTSFYLNRRGSGFAGVVTTRPRRTSGLDGAVSYWVEISRSEP